eukprot:4010976-Amphidinium_carterae.1
MIHRPSLNDMDPNVIFDNQVTWVLYKSQKGKPSTNRPGTKTSTSSALCYMLFNSTPSDSYSN